MNSTSHFYQFYEYLQMIKIKEKLPSFLLFEGILE